MINPTNRTSLAKAPPPPIHESIITNNRPTQALVRYLIEIAKKDPNVYDEIDRVIEFANNIQVGAGLNNNGTYSPDIVAKYISLATSLKDADSLLDEAIWNYTRVLVTTVSGDASLFPSSQTILCNAISGVININLPNPSECFEGGRSFKVAVEKIDTSGNFVNILPFGAELIVGETNQILNTEGDILNFITDGTNWYLQN
jgi:hypothetical protein